MKHGSPGRRAAVVAAGFIAAFVLAACGSNASGGGAVPAKSNSATGSRSGATFNGVDVMFLRMMIPHHQQAVEMATLAQTRAADPRVKQLAARIKATQTSEIATMNRWLTAWGQPTTMPNDHDMSAMPGGGMMPSAMPGRPGGMMPSAMPGTPGCMTPSGMPRMPGMMSSADMARLTAATGKDFDKQFLQMMIVHHTGAIQMARAEQAYGSNPDVKALAGRIIKDQQAEIATMQKMLAGT